MLAPAILGRHFRRLALLFGCLGAAVAMIDRDLALGQQTGQNSNFERCRAITEDAARLRCFENATAKPATPAAPQTSKAGAGTWRLVRTKNPNGGKDAVSIMQTANIAKSDLDLAGLMLRCGESGVEVLLVLVEPLPPRAHPKVTVSAAGRSADFIARIVTPGAALLLPQEATELALNVWTTASELAVQIDPGQSDSNLTAIRGAIPLTGLAGALPLLTANCPAQ
jgi:hypothetical protein